MAELNDTVKRVKKSILEEYPEIDAMLTSKDMMTLIQAEINRNGIAGNHIESMNSFYKIGIQQIITKIYNIEFRMRNLRDANDEDKSIQEILVKVIATDVKLRKPMHTLHKSGVELPLFPQKARDQGLTYGCDIYIDADIIAIATLNNGTTKSRNDSISKFRIGATPCMEKSVMCNTVDVPRETLIRLGEDAGSAGGTFIINGTTWVVNNSEGVTYNAFHIQKQAYNKEIARGMFISKAGDTFENSSQHILRYMSDGAITFDIIVNRGENLEIPFYILFRALGMTRDKDIVDNIVNGVDNPSPAAKEMLKILKLAFEASANKFNDIRDNINQDEVVNYLGNQLIKVDNTNEIYTNDEIIRYINKQFLDLVDKKIMSHIGTESKHRILKLRFIANLINELLSVHLGITEATDRDSYKNKRISTAGISIAKSFKQLYNFSICKEFIRKLRKEFKSISFSEVNLSETIKNSIKPDELERLMSQSTTAGNKTMTVRRSEVKNRVSSQAISTPKNDMYVKAVLGTIAASSFNPSKQTDRADIMRRVHQTFIGYIDVSMSADTGELVGTTKQLASTSSICAGSSSYTLKKILLTDKLILIDVLPSTISRHNLAKVFVNGDWIGCCKQAHELVRKYRKLRRTNDIHRRTTIVWEPLVRKVLFLVDVGRLQRPLVIVYNNIEKVILEQRAGNKNVEFRQWIKLTHKMILAIRAKKLTIEDLEEDNVVEYITAEEQENTYIASNIDTLREHSGLLTNIYTHCDIDQALLSIVTLGSPLANYSNPTRITYYTNHRKQSSGWFAMNYPYTMYKNTIMQWYCERPLVSTIADSLTTPTGHNCMVAVAMYKGTLQEDSLILSQTGIDCGLYNASYYTTEKTKLEKDESFESVDRFHTKGISAEANYEYIEDGAIKKDTIVVKNVVLICKVLKLAKPIGNFTHIDKSIIYRGDEEFVVDRIIRGQNGLGVKFIKVRLRSQRHIEIGDKMSTRTGNKGIYSRREQRINMYYTADGIRCSMMGGPHSFPSRMAVNQCLEMRLGQQAAEDGMLVDGTTFQNIVALDIGKNVEHKNDLSRDLVKYLGSRKVMNGETNEWVDALIFMAPCNYMRLQKFSIDSMYASFNSPKTEATRQPVEGRAKGGGLKIGEMETWVYSAQGAMRSLDEKFYTDSDGQDIYVCKCGEIASVNEKYNIYRCNNCQDNASIGIVSSSWCTNKLVKGNEGMNIRTTLELELPTFEKKL
jgi:DNA-directed RNA polymerase beta subunit